MFIILLIKVKDRNIIIPNVNEKKANTTIAINSKLFVIIFLHVEVLGR